MTPAETAAPEHENESTEANVRLRNEKVDARLALVVFAKCKNTHGESKVFHSSLTILLLANF